VIFDFYVVRPRWTEEWQVLVHVCRRWRCVVFGSPRRLNLQLVCTSGTPVRERLDIWPALPLIVDGTISSTSVDNIVVALGHSDRVCRINLYWQLPRGLEWDQALAAMQLPFPALTGLQLDFPNDATAPIIPDTFLGGSAPLLEYFKLDRIPFPGIPNLLFSATHLVHLDLSIPHSRYISPEAMAACLSALTSLGTLFLFSPLDFLYSRLRRRLPLITRSILPDLKRVCFKGASEYLDELVARIDAPRLEHLIMIFPLDQMNIDTPHRHLVQFISRTPRFQEPNGAHVTLDLYAEVKLLWASDQHARLSVEISYEGFEADLQPSFIAQAYTMCLPPLPR
jgi:hypothetical protein